MEDISEYIVVLNSKSGRSSRPGPGTPFAKYFLESERIATPREHAIPPSTADLLAELFPTHEYPDGPVFHRVQADSDGRQEIVTSWCVFPVDNSSPKHVSMTIPLPSLNTTSTPRTKFCKDDRLKLLEACYGGTDNIRYNVHQTALIGSLVVGGANGRQRICVCIPSGHVRLQSIASGLHLQPLFQDETGVRRPYLFKLTLIHNGPGTNKSKSGIPISNNLFFSMFWGDHELMRLLEMFVPDRQAATGRDLTTTATTATATTATTVTTVTMAPSSEISSRAYPPAALPGRGKGLMSIRAQQAEMSDMVRNAREKLEHIFHTCLADTRSSSDEVKFSVSILSTLLRDSTASKTLEGREHGGQGLDVEDDDEQRISLHEFADIVDKLGDVVNSRPPRHVVYQPPCHRVLAIFKHYLENEDDSFVSFENVNTSLFNALKSVGVLDTMMMIP